MLGRISLSKQERHMKNWCTPLLWFVLGLHCHEIDLITDFDAILTGRQCKAVRNYSFCMLIRWQIYLVLYNNPCYSRILIGSRLWSIRGQTHDWRHHYKGFLSAVLKWRKVVRIRIIFYVTGQKVRYKKVLPSHWTGSRSKKTKDKAVSFRKWYRNNFLAASVGSRVRLNHAQTWSS